MLTGERAEDIFRDLLVDYFQKKGIEPVLSIYTAADAEEGIKRWEEIKEKYRAAVTINRSETGDISDVAGYCTIAFIDSDMPAQSGLEGEITAGLLLSRQLSNDSIPTGRILYTGRELQLLLLMNGDSTYHGNNLQEYLRTYGIQHLVLKGSTPSKLLDLITEMFKERLDIVTSPGYIDPITTYN